MPTWSILQSFLGANIVSPSCRLHEQHKAMIGVGNISNPSLPLVCVPGMFRQRYFYLLNGGGVLLLKDLICDDPGEHMAGDVPGDGGAGKRHDGG